MLMTCFNQHPINDGLYLGLHAVHQLAVGVDQCLPDLDFSDDSDQIAVIFG